MTARTVEERTARHRIASNLRLLQLGDDVVAELAQRGISALFLKGAGFIDTLYTGIGDRPITDVDILIPARDQSRCRQILEEQGWAFVSPPAHKLSGWAGHYNWQYRSQDGALLEVHTGLCPHGLYAIDYQGIFSRQITYLVNGRKIPTMGNEDSLLGLAIHEAKHFYNVPPHSSEDVSRLLAQRTLDWKIVLRRAKSWNCATALFLTLRRGGDTNRRVPIEVLTDLNPGLWKTKALKVAFADLERPRLSRTTPSRKQKLAAALLLADSNRNRFQFLRGQLGRRTSRLTRRQAKP